MLNGERVRALEGEVAYLKEKVEKMNIRLYGVEIETEAFRVGDPPMLHFFSPYTTHEDTRPKVTMHRAIALICDHLKLRFSKTTAVPETVLLEKVKP